MAHMNLAFKRALADVSKDTAARKSSNSTTNTISATVPPAPDSAAAATPDDVRQQKRLRRSGCTASSSSVSQPPAILSDIELSEDNISLSADISAVRVHQLAVTLRPLPVGAGGAAGAGSRPKMSASRWEVRKAMLSLCSTQPVMFEVSRLNGEDITVAVCLSCRRVMCFCFCCWRSKVPAYGCYNLSTAV